MTGFFYNKDGKKIERTRKKRPGKDFYKPHDADEKLLDEELRDRGKLVRLICLIAAAVLLLGIIGTISIVNITYEGEDGLEGLDLAAISENGNAETIAQLTEVQKYLDYLGSSVEGSSATLKTLSKDQELLKESSSADKEQQTEIRTNITELSDRMRSLDKEISSVRTEVTTLIEALRSEEERSYEEYTGKFSEINGRVNALGDALSASIADIGALIGKLQGTEKEDYESLIASLSRMKDSLSADNVNSLSTLQALLGNLNTDMLSKFDTLNSDLTTSFDTLNTDLTTNFENLNTDMSTRLAAVENNFNLSINGEGGLRAYIESGFSNLDDKLTSVFQSVANGKSLLATALATKGQTVASDATFTEIRDAILAIDQQLVVGVAHLPGEIEYLYHYHTDDTGNQVDTDSVGTYGGCYTAGYHVHTGSCPTGSRQVWNGHDADTTRDSCSKCGTPIDHTGGTGSCPYGAWTTETYYTCGGSPINRYRKGCGLANGQIVGATIKYANYDYLPADSIIGSAALSGTAGTTSVSGSSAKAGMMPLRAGGADAPALLEENAEEMTENKRTEETSKEAEQTENQEKSGEESDSGRKPEEASDEATEPDRQESTGATGSAEPESTDSNGLTAGDDKEPENKETAPPETSEENGMENGASEERTP